MLTLSQNRTLHFIEKFINQHGYAPTTAEIAAGIGIKSRGVVHRYISALVEQKLLKIIPGRRRNIELIKKTDDLLPLIGRIAAGKPIEAVKQDEAIDVLNIFLGEGRYALKVKGDSMVEEGILDGDLVVCQYAQEAPSGKIVVALIDGQEATLKKIRYNNDNTITLIPANKVHKALTLPNERVQIQGIYIGLLRFDYY